MFLFYENGIAYAIDMFLAYFAPGFENIVLWHLSSDGITNQHLVNISLILHSISEEETYFDGFYLLLFTHLLSILFL